MDISVIIINYNVKHFLEQCLFSVYKAVGSKINAEVIVVDNASIDHSLEYLQPKFPSTRFIANKENIGFSKACNQGLKEATGNLILFLNPDTILPEDCLSLSIEFLQTHPNVGAIGVKMLDGAGGFLKESKRAFPSPITSLFKLAGLSRIFPHSKIFAAYHLGHLSENENHEVDVLAGAFMIVRKEVLDKTGGFDEVFFMYGEDIDLSYRIQQAGYQNFYFAGTSIIHFKGESTKRVSMNYVRMFYTAMSIFVKKHYGGSRAGIFIFLIQIAIWLRAAMTAIASFIRKIGLPVIDAGVTILSFWLMKKFWNGAVRPDTIYQDKMLWIAFPAFTFIYLVTAYYAGLYDRWYKRMELAQSTLLATLVLLAGYSLLPEMYRFSRAILLLGALGAFVFISFSRWILLSLDVLKVKKQREGHANTIVVGSASEYQNSIVLMNNKAVQEKILGRVSIETNESGTLGNWESLDKFPDTISFTEVIFCEGTLSFKQIIQYLPRLKNKIRIKIHAFGSGSIIGSALKNTTGETLSNENGFLLADPYNRRLKRLIDVFVSIIGIIGFPVHLIGVRKPGSFFVSCIQVLLARKTWVGYSGISKSLPTIRPAILSNNGTPPWEIQELPDESLRMMDYWYARDYEPLTDLRIIWRGYRKLGG